MNVMIYNKYKDLLLGLNIDVMKSLEGVYNVDEIIVAAREEDIPEITRMCVTFGIRKCSKVIRGGEDRVHSVMRAALEASPQMSLLAVQDGARPLVSVEVIDRVIEEAARTNAAAPAVSLKDTVKEVREDGSVLRTPDRSSLRAIQTPQVFSADLLKAALQSSIDDGASVTDDCGAVERLGKIVYLVEGDEANIKITTPTDLYLAEAILRAREESR